MENILENTNIKTYVWYESYTFETYCEFIVVTAKSLDEARNIAVKEIYRVCEENCKSSKISMHIKFHLEERDAFCKAINTEEPEVLEIGTAKKFLHANQ